MWFGQRRAPRRKLTPEQQREAQVTIFWAMALCLLAGLSFAGGSEVRQWHRFALLAFVLAYQLPVLARSLKIYRGIQSSNRLRRIQGRASWWHYAWHWLTDVPLLALLAITCGETWTWAQIGFTETVPWDRSFGMACLALLFYFSLMSVISSRSAATPTSHFQRSTRRMDLPRGCLGKIFGGVQTAVVGPTLEDLVYRGFLIHYLGHVSGSMTLGVTTGLALFLVLHLYQGTKSLLYLLLWFTMSVVLLLSPFGLLAVMMMHVLHNAYYVLTIVVAGSRNVQIVTGRESTKPECATTRP